MQAAKQQLIKALIKQAHADDKMIVIALFVKLLEEDLETAQWILDEYGHTYEAAQQLHMRNMLQGQLMLNAGADVLISALLAHMEQLAAQGGSNTAQQATDALLSKFKLH